MLIKRILSCIFYYLYALIDKVSSSTISKAKLRTKRFYCKFSTYFCAQNHFLFNSTTYPDASYVYIYCKVSVVRELTLLATVQMEISKTIRIRVLVLRYTSTIKTIMVKK